MSGVPGKPMCARSALILTIALLIALVSPASAAITGATIISGGTGASFIKLTVPFDTSTLRNTIGEDTFQTNNLYGFDEDQNIVLAAPLTVDTTVARSTILAAGRKVKSHSIFFDPVSGSIDATVDFDSDIVGLILSTLRLVASDSLEGGRVTYLSPALRGLEIDDSVTISGPRQIRFTSNASTPGDYIRVLTAESDVVHLPEPGTATTVSLVLALAAFRYGWLRSSRF